MTNIRFLLRILLPLGALLAFLGYVGPWVDHRVAGLAVLGLDLGEYVKFLPQVRAGTTGHRAQQGSGVVPSTS